MQLLCVLPTEVEYGRGSVAIRAHCPTNILHNASMTDLSVACNLVRELQEIQVVYMFGAVAWSIIPVKF